VIDSISWEEFELRGTQDEKIIINWLGAEMYQPIIENIYLGLGIPSGVIDAVQHNSCQHKYEEVPTGESKNGIIWVRLICKYCGKVNIGN